MIDLSELETGLGKLRGLDYEAAYAASGELGSLRFAPNTEPRFQIELAARALGRNVFDLRELPLKEYQQICQRVAIFLNRVEDATALESSDASRLV